MNGDAVALLVEMGVKGTVLLAVAGAAAGVLRRGAAAMRHAVWSAAMGGLLVLPALALVVPAVRIVPGAVRGPERVERAESPGVAAAPVKMEAGVAVERPVLTAARTSVNGAAGSVSAGPAVRGRGVDWVRVGIGVYLCGVVVGLLPLVVGSWRRRRLLRSGAGRALDSELVRSVVRELGMRRGVPVVVSGAVEMPMAAGLLRPRVYLPAEAGRWPGERLRAVLLHELGHVRRRDLQTQAMAAVARAVYWPHPLAWVACRQMEIEREKACDDLAVSRGIDARAYAQMLLEIATLFQRSPVMRYAAVSMARPSSLEGRIRAVLAAGARRGAVGRGMLVALVMATLGVTAGLAALAAAPGGGAAASAIAAGAPATEPGALPAGMVSIVAVGASGGGPFWTADGQPTVVPAPLAPMPPAVGRRVVILRVHGAGENASPPMAMLRKGHEAMPIGMKTVPTFAAAGADAEKAQGNDYYQIDFPMGEAAGFQLEVGIATAAWTTFAEGDHALSGKTGAGSYVAGDATETSPPSQEGWGGGGRRPNPANLAAMQPYVSLKLAYDFSNSDVRVVAVFTDGSEHPMNNVDASREGSLEQLTAVLHDATLQEIKTFRYQVRPIEWASFDHLALEPATGKAAGGGASEAPAADATVTARLQERRAMETSGGDGASYYIMGSVQRPGVYSILGKDLTLLQAVAAAGIQDASPEKDLYLKAVRSENGKESVAFEGVLGDLKGERVQANDVLTVGPAAAERNTPPMRGQAR